MGYAWMGRVHAALLGARRHAGQGTVEYVALILLVAVVLAGVVAAARKTTGGIEIAEAIVKQIKNAIDKVK